MAFSISITARKLLNRANLLTTAGLNALGFNTITLTGQADTADIADDAITPAKLEYGAYHWASTGGTANAITLTTGNSLSGTPETGEVVAFKASNTNTGAVQVTVDSYSAANLYKHGATALEADDIRSGQIYEIRFDGTYWQMIGTRGKREVIVGVDANSGDNYEFTPDPGVTAHANKDIVFLKCNTANTGAASLGGVAIKKQKDQDLASGDIKAGQWVVLVHDGTYWQMVSPVSNIQSPGIPGNNAGLIVTPNSGTPASKLDVDADWISLADSSGNAISFSDVDVTIDITASRQENGRDTASAEATSTDYWVYLCYDQNAGGSVFGLISTTSTAPDSSASTGVAYTHWAKVGWVYNDSGGDFAQHASYRQGRWYFVSDAKDLAASTQTFTWAHPFGRKPTAVQLVALADGSELGYTAADEIPSEMLRDGSSVKEAGLGVVSSTTSLTALQLYAALYAPHKTSYGVAAITETAWDVKLYAEF